MRNEEMGQRAIHHEHVPPAICHLYPSVIWKRVTCMWTIIPYVAIALRGDCLTWLLLYMHVLTRTSKKQRPKNKNQDRKIARSED
jgi:hypothetical protein